MPTIRIDNIEWDTAEPDAELPDWVIIDPVPEKAKADDPMADPEWAMNYLAEEYGCRVKSCDVEDIADDLDAAIESKRFAKRILICAIVTGALVSALLIMMLFGVLGETTAYTAAAAVCAAELLVLWRIAKRCRQGRDGELAGREHVAIRYHVD